MVLEITLAHVMNFMAINIMLHISMQNYNGIRVIIFFMFFFCFFSIGVYFLFYRLGLLAKIVAIQVIASTYSFTVVLEPTYVVKKQLVLLG